MRKNRQYNPAGLITGTIAQAVRCRKPIDRLVLGIDECVNEKAHIRPLCSRLVAAGIAFISINPWHQLREDAQGQRFLLSGSSISPSPLIPDTGRPVPGYGDEDELMVTMLMANFLSVDRLCLLTENAKKDEGGLYLILKNEVGPALEGLSPRRLGLLVLCKRPRATYAEYGKAVEDRLRHSKVLPGYRWELTG